MGIVNVTPDSFSDGGLYLDVQRAVRHGQRLVEDGADVLDIGGESTRPNSAPVSLGEELRRVIPVVKALAGRIKASISVDTSKADVARQALDAGATMINDVTALRDPRMGPVIARAGASVVLMHMHGTPQTMQRAPRYRNVVADVRTFLAQAITRANAAGIKADRIWIDPGLGFGKTVEHNLRLMRELEAFGTLGAPIVVGPSRKSFIGNILDVETSERLSGTLACVAAAAEHGARMVRVHDVKETAQFLRMWDAIRRQH